MTLLDIIKKEGLDKDFLDESGNPVEHLTAEDMEEGVVAWRYREGMGGDSFLHVLLEDDREMSISQFRYHAQWVSVGRFHRRDKCSSLKMSDSDEAAGHGYNIVRPFGPWRPKHPSKESLVGMLKLDRTRDKGKPGACVMDSCLMTIWLRAGGGLQALTHPMHSVPQYRGGKGGDYATLAADKRWQTGVREAKIRLKSSWSTQSMDEIRKPGALLDLMEGLPAEGTSHVASHRSGAYTIDTDGFWVVRNQDVLERAVVSLKRHILKGALS